MKKINYIPVCYYYKSFTKPERNYSIIDKELLAIIATLEEWRHLLMCTNEPVVKVWGSD